MTRQPEVRPPFVAAWTWALYWTLVWACSVFLLMERVNNEPLTQGEHWALVTALAICAVLFRPLHRYYQGSKLHPKLRRPPC
jgi:hypothetical protein